jgi:hypothetical protein
VAVIGAIWLFAWRGEFTSAMAAIGIVAIDALVLAVSGGSCPIDPSSRDIRTAAAQISISICRLGLQGAPSPSLARFTRWRSAQQLFAVAPVLNEPAKVVASNWREEKSKAGSLIKYARHLTAEPSH